MSKKKRSLCVYVKFHGLSGYEVESLKDKFCSFASNLDMIFDFDYIGVSELRERKNDL